MRALAWQKAKRSEGALAGGGDRGGQRGPRGDEDQFVSYRQIALRRDKNVLEFKLLPAITCSDAVIVCVHAALVPRNKLSPTVILPRGSNSRAPGTVAVNLALRTWAAPGILNIVSKLAIFTSPIFCLGGERHHMRRMRAGGDSQRSMAAGELLVHRRSLKMLPG